MISAIGLIQAHVTRPDGLSPAEEVAWRAMQAAHPDFGDPLFGVDFAKAVGAVREDAWIAVFRRDGRTIGFLAHHRRPSGFARPIGAPFCDYHALISAPGEPIDGAEALAAAGLSALRCSGLVDPHGVFEGAMEDVAPAHRMALDTDPAAYLEALRAASPKRFKNERRLEHKLEREVGPIELVAGDVGDEGFKRLIGWKRDHARRTGTHDFMGPDWTRRLMRQLFETRCGDFAGLMLTLTAGGRPIAAHFGVRQADWYHPWIAATDPAFAAWSPGQIFLARAITAMPGLGLRVYDLGVGHDHYKRPFSNGQMSVSRGLAAAATESGRRAGAWERVWNLADNAGAPAVGRVRRRLDHIAAVELSAAGRVRGVFDAIRSSARREASRPSGPGAAGGQPA
jgi:CelD/BcsL family acetyltransferase involved in cellulose biosynthesis